MLFYYKTMELLPLFPIASCLLPLASCLLPLASCLLPLASCLLPIVSCLLPLASCLFINLDNSFDNAIYYRHTVR
ncbi:MAG: hypothetical protein F6K56_14575 [Moorea sp. SIO3G5]|nr:hypothetical protein [Moorena sp. SIO3G5]